MSMISSTEKPFDLNLEELKNYDPNKWVKMICCIPSEFKKIIQKLILKEIFYLELIRKRFLKPLILNLNHNI